MGTLRLRWQKQMPRKAEDPAGLAAVPLQWGQIAVGAQLWGMLKRKGHQLCLGESQETSERWGQRVGQRRGKGAAQH